MILPRHEVLVAGPGSLPGLANRESGENPERPRRGDRAKKGVTPQLAIADPGVIARLVRRPDIRARESEDLPASIAAIALRGTGDVELPLLFSRSRDLRTGKSPASFKQFPSSHATICGASTTAEDIDLLEKAADF